MKNPDHYTQSLGQRLERFRLSNDISQAALSKTAGIGERTLRRLESGEGGTIESLVRVLVALKLDGNLDALIPDHSIRPIERVRESKTERLRASSVSRDSMESGKTVEKKVWVWGDERDDKQDDPDT